MNFFQILLLALIQGAAELLPVSSSAHVIMAEKLMGLDPSSPEMTLLLVMLHTGTMFAVILYFLKDWKAIFFSSKAAFRAQGLALIIATLCTGAVGMLIKKVIEKGVLRAQPDAEIEQLFGNLLLIAVSLAAAGALIVIAGRSRAASAERSASLPIHPEPGGREITAVDAGWIGAVQGLCLPFRGFSRSGATISTGLLRGLERHKMEAFSFALAVVLTPAVIVREALRLWKARETLAHLGSGMDLFLPSMIGMVFSFGAGLLALRWLSSWLEKGRWKYFGYYCFGAAAVAFALYLGGW